MSFNVRHTMKMPVLPETLRDIYPNNPQRIFGTPAVIFRDHRWTLPILFFGRESGLLQLPAVLVTFDRHPDALKPVNSVEPLALFRAGSGALDELVRLVRNHLSPRDDDWIVSGMELGLISDVIQFNSNIDSDVKKGIVREYRDSQGMKHLIFRLGRPAQELSYTGAFVDISRSALNCGIRERLGWEPSKPETFDPAQNIVVDIDCDFFTFSWDNYTFPFPDEVYKGEFFCPCQSDYYDSLLPARFLRSLIRAASIVTVATEPDFCGGTEKSGRIFSDVNRHLFENELDETKVGIDYLPVYPHE